MSLTPLTATRVTGVDGVTYEKLNSTTYYTTPTPPELPLSNSTNYYGNVNVACLEVTSGNTISSFTNSGIILGGGGAGNGSNNMPNGAIPALSFSGKSAFLNNGTITFFKNSGALLGGGGAGGFGADNRGAGGAGGGGGGNNPSGPGISNGGSLVGHYYQSLTNVVNNSGRAIDKDGSTNSSEAGGGGGGPGGKGGGTNGGTGGRAMGGYGGSNADNGYTCSSTEFIYGGGGGGGRSTVGSHGGGGGGYGCGKGGDGLSNGAAGGGGGGGLPGSAGSGHNPGGKGGYSIDNQGTIGTLSNAQGGTGYVYGPLFYNGNLPANYNIIINSASSYGQLYGPVSGSSTLSNFNIDSTSTINFTDTVTLSQVIYGYYVNSNNLSGTFISSNNITYTWELIRKEVIYTQSNGTNTITIPTTSYTIAYDLKITFPGFNALINNVNSPPTYTTITGTNTNLTVSISNSSLIRSDTTSLYLDNVLIGCKPATFNGTFVSNGNTYAWQLLVVPNSDPIRYNLVIILASMLSGIYINNIDMSFLFKTSF